MKKRIVSLLLCFAVVCGFALYGAADEAQEEMYVVYFQERDLESVSGGGALRAESARISKDTELETQQLAELLVNDLLDGPRDETLKSTVPGGTTLMSLELQGTRAVVDLSGGYGTLSGVALTLADQALALTLTQLPDIMSVKITVRGRELAYREKQVFTAQNVLLAPEGDVIGTVDVALYFLNENGMLMQEQRTLELYEGETQVGAVSKAVLNGPEDKNLSAVYPEGFRVKSVWQEEETCYVNLSTGILENLAPDARLATALRALAKSLCSLESVSEVRYLVDGEFRDRYGSITISRAYTG